MAHPSHRRNLPPPQRNPNPDLIQRYQPSFLVKHLTSLNLTQSHNNSPIIDTHSHAKAMSAATKDKQGAVTVPAKTTHKDKPQRPCLELERRKIGGSDDKGVVEDAKVHKQKPHLEKPDVSVSLGGGRRRSYRGSQVDLRDAFAINGAKMVSADMPPFMQIHAVDCARKAFDSMEKFTSKTLALSLKKEFDVVYGPAWHCIVGTSFGSFVTHSVGGFLYFSMDQKLYILLFKTSVQKAG